MRNNRIKLNNGREIPLMGLGTHRIQNADDIVYNSIKDGIRLIDTSTRY
jgi:diketogulonate reductase-like aldo/keto reductase